VCDRAEWIIARKAVEVAQAEWDLIGTIENERRVHAGAIARAREILVRRGDAMALDIFDQVVGTAERQGADLEKARVMVEGE
jgi:hypothetical protein